MSLSALYAWALAHGPAILAVAAIVLPSLITGLSEYPGPEAATTVKVLKFMFNLLSLVQHRDSPGTFKFPLVSMSKPPQGFARLSTMAWMAFVAAFLAALASAHAAPNPDALAGAVASDPAAVQPGADVPPPSSQFGGCVGKVCFGPSLAISLASYNFTTGKLEAAFAPGVGYGFTVAPGSWKSFGADVYVTLSPAAQQASVSLLAKVFNGYFRPGLSKSFVSDHSLRFLFSTGVDLP